MPLRRSLSAAAQTLALTLVMGGCGGGGDAGPLDGEQAWLTSCVACHGVDGRGTYQGPDIVWGISSLSVEEVVEVVEFGVGDMEPVPGLTEEEVDNVANYVVDVLRASVGQ